MVEVAGANRMMPGLDMFCLADSGHGVKIAGFHCPILKFQEQFDRLRTMMPEIDIVASLEQESMVTFLAAKLDYSGGKPSVKTFRREVHTFFRDLPKFLAHTDAADLDQMILTGSSGALFLTLLCRE